jgi:hypothetical protein
LGEIAGAARRREFGRARAHVRLRARQLILDREQPRDHALDIAVDRARAAIEGDRRDRGGRIGADPREREQRLLGVGKPSVVALDHGFGAGVQVAGTRVVAEPGPKLQHVVERCGGQSRDRREALEEARIVRSDRAHGGLLQHDLGEPHLVGIGPLAGTRTPRQHAAMAVVPSEQIGGLRPDKLRRDLLVPRPSC